jgi:hypothetical protein
MHPIFAPHKSTNNGLSMSIEPVINKQRSLFILVIAHRGFVSAGRVFSIR